MIWTIRASLDAAGNLDVTLPEADGQTGVRRLADAKPVELLVAAVAICFVKSCANVIAARGAPPAAIRCEVVAHKAGDKPARVARMVVRYAIDGMVPDVAARIAKDGKRICTVSNTLNCESVLEAGL